jgi:translation initiation factor 3 subunit F
MAVATESFLHLARPLAPATVGQQPTTAPLNVIIQPQVSQADARAEKC